MELIHAYCYPPTGEFQAAINRQKALRNELPGYWVTKEGIAVLPERMYDNHLLNAMNRCESNMKLPGIRNMVIDMINMTYKKSNYSRDHQQLSKAIRKNVTYLDMVQVALKRNLI